ncbi:hypothetical protein [Ignavibacterium sp.]|uniref:hypothetical protein n=1 Tax=Ignavibacterium sp. TaxID=2651167 RepID=UPI002201005F|nr:hypothetical protein [Ignavibacterium sp.]BDQ01559.1 MAG: hypothetical protein KatS3mg037_0134 [Ignavibacterium sp.]
MGISLIRIIDFTNFMTDYTIGNTSFRITFFDFTIVQIDSTLWQLLIAHHNK